MELASDWWMPECMPMAMYIGLLEKTLVPLMTCMGRLLLLLKCSLTFGQYCSSGALEFKCTFTISKHHVQLPKSNKVAIVIYILESITVVTFTKRGQ